MVLNAIRRYYSEMSQAEKRVADYITEHLGEIVDMSLAELANRSGTSDATIIRMCRHIGYSGFYQLKIGIVSFMTEPERSAFRGTRVTKPRDVTDFFDSVARNIEEIPQNISMPVLQECIDLISGADTVYILAWGNTGAIAADFAHRLTRIGIRSFVSDVPEYAMRSLGLCSEKDVLIGISHSGESIHVIQALTLAKELKVRTILITDTEDSNAAKLADRVLFTNMKEQPFGDLGGASHVSELLVIDAILYFMKSKEAQVSRGDRTEFVLSQYKM